MPEHTPAPTPHRAIYGFSFYLLFLTLSIVYLLWAVLPTDQLSGYLRLNYLPDKYFALCLPMLALCGLFFFAFLIYPAINLSLTPNIDELSSVVDIKLALRNSKHEGCVWEQLAVNAEQKEESAIISEEELVQRGDCSLCREPHTRSNMPAIATLRFIDLNEMNKNFFD